VGQVFIATSSARGQPHIAAAGKLVLTPEKHIAVTEWFCPATMANLQVSPRLSLVVWDAAADTGYQLIGELESIKDIAMLDGYSPRQKTTVPIPQVERQLLVHVDKILKFKRSPHSDVEE
jgi:hypothetical protein